MKIKAKLLTGFLSLAVVVALVGGVGIYGMITGASQSQYISNIGDYGILVANLKTNIYQQRASYRGAALQKQLKTGDLGAAELDNLTTLDKEFNELLTSLRAVFTKDNETALLNPITTAYSEYSSARNDFVSKVNSNVSADELQKALTAVVDPINKTTTAIQAMVDYTTTTTTQVANSTQAQSNVLTTILIVVVVIAVGIAVVMGLYIAKLIATPATALVEAAKKLSSGDINVTLAVTSKDEMGDLASAFQEMADSIREQANVLARISDGDYTGSIPVRSQYDVMNKAINSMLDGNNQVMTEIRASSSQVSSGASQIAQASQNLATGSSQQAATLEEFTATITQIHNMSEQNTEKSAGALKDTQEASRVMDMCTAAMGEMLMAMKDIDNRSQSITKVIKVIDDIAFQTNILALNAAVEAARAGQHGKGFAVVADEVRNLASKSAEAAKETSALIEKSAQSVASGNSIVGKVNEQLSQVGILSQKSAESINQINIASNQQSNSMQEVTYGISQFSSVVQATSATAEQCAASSEEMSAQATVLDQIVSRFKLRGMENVFTAKESRSAAAEYAMDSGFSLSSGSDKY